MYFIKSDCSRTIIRLTFPNLSLSLSLLFNFPFVFVFNFVIQTGTSEIRSSSLNMAKVNVMSSIQIRTYHSSTQFANAQRTDLSVSSVVTSRNIHICRPEFVQRSSTGFLTLWMEWTMSYSSGDNAETNAWHDFAQTSENIIPPSFSASVSVDIEAWPSAANIEVIQVANSVSFFFFLSSNWK